MDTRFHQYQGYVEPFVQAPTPSLSWAPEFADFAESASRRASLRIAVAVCVMVAPVPPVQISTVATGHVSATIITAPQLLQYQGTAGPIAPTQAVSLSLAGAAAATIIPSNVTTQYQDYAAPAIVPVVVVVSGRAGGSQIPTVTVTHYQDYAAPSVVSSVPSLSWQPEFADTLRPAPRMASITPHVGVPQTVPAVAPLAWQGEWPDSFTAKPRQQPSGAVLHFAQATTPTLITWEPTYADAVRRIRTDVAESRLTAILDSLAVANDWAAEYPDWLPPPRRSTPESCTTAILDRLTVPTAWTPEYADFVPSPVRAQRQDVAAPVSVVTATPTQWEPTYSDFVRPAPRTSESAVVAVLDRLTAPNDWSPEYADAVPQRQRTAESSVVSVLNTTTTPTQWSPEYADFAPGAARAQTAMSVAVVLDRLTVPSAWTPDYVDIVPVAVRRTPEYQAVAGLLDRLTVPSAWTPEFADFVAAARRVPEYQATAVVLDRLTTPTDWNVSYPDRLAQATRPQPTETGDVFPQATLPLLDAWQGRWIDLAPRTVQTPGGWRTDVVSVTATPTQWAPEYADFVPAAARTQRPDVAAPVSVATTPTQWTPVYSDFVQTPKRTPLGGLTDSLAHPTLPLLQTWRATYADQFAAVRQARAEVVAPTVELSQTATTWDANYRDLTPRIATTPESQLVAPFQTLPTARAWSALYPDRIDGRQMATATQLAWASGVIPSGFTVPSLSWASEYADRVDARRFPLEALRWFALDPFPIAVPVNQFNWRARHPDWIPLLRPVEYPAFVTGLTASSLPLPKPLVWQGRYADAVAAAKRVLAPPPFALDAFPRPGVTFSWVPEYPDRFAAVVIVRSDPAATSFIQTSAPLLLSWEPTFADLIAGRRATPDTSVQTPTSASIVPPLSWQAIIADLVAGRRAMPDVQLVAPLAQATVPLLLSWKAQLGEMVRLARVVDSGAITAFTTSTLTHGWRPTFQDLQRPVAVAIDGGRVAPLDRLAVANAWSAVYPDLLRPALRAAETQFASAANPQIFVVQYRWTPVYPDRIARTAPAAESHKSQPFDRLAAPNAWEPSYPDAVVRRVLLDVARQQAWASSTASAYPVPAHAWAGVWPDFARSTTLPTADVPFESVRGRLAVPTVLTGWQPTFDDFARIARPINVAPAFAFTRLVFRGPEVIHYRVEVARQPLSAEERAGQPKFLRETAEPDARLIMTNQRAAQPTFTNERATQSRIDDAGEDT